jgi:alpha/beta superfamily hydrolase
MATNKKNVKRRSHIAKKIPLYWIVLTNNKTKDFEVAYNFGSKISTCIAVKSHNAAVQISHLLNAHDAIYISYSLGIIP